MPPLANHVVYLSRVTFVRLLGDPSLRLAAMQTLLAAADEAFHQHAESQRAIRSRMLTEDNQTMRELGHVLDMRLENQQKMVSDLRLEVSQSLFRGA